MSRLLGGTSRRHFENQVALVREALGVPVALVSLIEADRQVFAAHLGLPEPWNERGETPLTHSFCKHVVSEAAPLVVPDALEDPLVRDNLAVADLSVRAYLGVPITLPGGTVVGALAAIDDKPRRWSERDASLLHAIARVVSDELETRVSETEWQSLFEQMQEGFILGEVIRDAGGRVADWRYKRVNRAWGELVGVVSEEATGRTIREVFPGIEDEWVDEFANVVETREPIRFTRQVGRIGRWYDGVTQAIGPDTFVTMFVEVTERMESHARQDAMVELGDRLRDVATVEEAGFAAADIMARVLGGTRAGYGIVDAADESVRILPDVCAPGVASIAGLHRFRNFGSYIEDLKRGGKVIVPDVAEDPRTRAAAEAFRPIGITALVNLPIIERGQLTGVVIVHDDRPRPFSRDEVSFISAVGDRTQAAVAKIQAQAEQDMLNQEISHRLKNSLALVQAVASQTLRNVAEREPVEAFEKRLHALSSAHDILLRRSWSTASMEAVLRGALDALGQEARARVEGPDVQLGSRAALSLSLLVHELATNAMKYGALSAGDGRVSATWETEGDRLVFRWEERGGPPVRQPEKKGFGSRMIRLGLVGAGEVELSYAPEGFSARMEASLAQLAAA